MQLAVQIRRGKSEQVLATQLLSDARERTTQVVRLRKLEVPATSLLGDTTQVARGSRRSETHPVKVLGFQSDGVHHYFLVARAFKDGLEVDPTGGVVTIGKHQYDASAVDPAEGVQTSGL
jgi:hypothetical protein